MKSVKPNKNYYGAYLYTKKMHKLCLRQSPTPLNRKVTVPATLNDSIL